MDDLADACLFLMNLPDEEYNALLFAGPHSMPLINIGCGADSSIKELAGLINEVVGYRGDITWDDSKPDGTLLKLLDVSRLHGLGWHHTTPLKQGIEKTYEWYREKAGI